MDEQLRRKAENKMAHATLLEQRGQSKYEILDSYENVIKFLTRLENKTHDDYKNMSSAYESMAIIQFNLKRYSKAAKYYHESISHLQQTILNDNTYRIITQRYIDLADACCELFNQSAANDAINNAIQAFRLIKDKTELELAIGDPIDNFKAFHEYYESNTSTYSYMQSTKFKNHEQLLLEKQQEATFLGQFNDFSIKEIQQLNNDIEGMLLHLSVSEEPRKNHFNPVLFQQRPSNTEYKNTAKDFLRIAQDHIKKGVIRSSISSYEQALGALRQLENPSENDSQIIDTLTSHIAYLKEKPTLAKPAVIFPMFSHNESFMDADDDVDNESSYYIG